ncbi:hypothetical protein FEE96_17520 [Parasedimentitalea maritima]|uniref:Uncharacterized protein n=1 Tax=Parasedimentitalea maritima TaxID=2578117 RepID=A0ABY2URL1_9RHOB|nr:DUF6505 family protein [Zongyanglinia marina]TLP59394.1 hypothetical protein FEE96_17520 [Zongyanglinia marina]
MQLARAIHFDESDQRVFASPARTGEWCVSGGFEFSNWGESDLSGKPKQAFSNGWMGLETAGRVTFVAVTQIEQSELDTLTGLLAKHFVDFYSAPDINAARPVATEELAQMLDLCAEHDANTLLTVSRELTSSGVKEAFRTIEPQAAGLEQFAIHGDMDA